MLLLAATTTLLALAAALPNPSTVTIEKRGVSNACQTEPAGSGPTPYPNDAYTFLRFGTFNSASTIAKAPTGYQRTFHNHLQSTNGQGYIGLYTLTSYDTTGCSTLCNGTAGCTGFNLYYERDPTLNPAPACANPTAMTNIKCTLWRYPPTVVNATNAGETRTNFTVVIAGSNGFAKLGSVSASLADDGTNPYD